MSDGHGLKRRGEQRVLAQLYEYLWYNFQLYIQLITRIIRIGRKNTWHMARFMHHIS